MLIRVFLGILLSCVFCAGLAHAQTAEEIADHIQHSYETMRSFDATFVQKQTRAMINSVNTSGGVIRYRNPSLVRWETLEPEEAREIIVVGPEYVWDYVLETKNAAKMHVSELFSSKTLLRFISGQANLRKEFRVENAWEGFENLQKRWDDTSLLLLRLVPFEPEANMVLAYIGVLCSSLSLQGIRMLPSFSIFGQGLTQCILFPKSF